MSINRKWLRTGIFWLLTVLVVFLVVLFVFRPQSHIKSVDVSTILNHIKADIKEGQQDILTVGNGTLTLTRGNIANAPEEAATINDTFDVTSVLQDNKIGYTNTHQLTLEYDAPSPVWGWLSAIGSFIPFLFFGLLIVFILRQTQGNNNQAISFGKSRARMFMGSKQMLTFADIAGVDEAKQELQEIVEFLKYPEKFVALGARIPKGLLLV
jgi:cell division protease FtsH